MEQAIPPHLTLMECGEFGFNNFNLILRSLHIFKNDLNVCFDMLIFEDFFFSFDNQTLCAIKCLIWTHYVSDILRSLTPSLPGKC